MKKRVKISFFVIAAVLFIFPIFCSASEVVDLNSKTLTMNLWVTSNLSVIPLEAEYTLRDVVWRLKYLPKNSWQQSVISLDISPTYTEANDSLYFYWENPTQETLDYSLSAKIQVRNELIKVRKKLDFPLGNLEPELERYVQSSQNINSDDQRIVELASGLAEGEDDLYYVVFRFFNWVGDNIKYNKTTLTETSSKSALWVLENRYGVCDELTTLFMALTRSMGIPSRYVSGVAYSDTDGTQEWQTHAWAELYFPGYGWLPFDVTYREFGYVDPTHIILNIEADSNQSTSFVSWVGSNVKLKQAGQRFKIDLLQKEGKEADPLLLEIEPVRKKVAIGSYSIIKATIKNPTDYYVSTDLRFSQTEGLSISDKDIKHILLRPREEKDIFWLIRVEEGLDSSYVYTFPIGVRTTRNNTASTNLTSQLDYPQYSEKEMQSLLNELNSENMPRSISNIGVSCKPDKQQLYTYETTRLACDLKNLGNLNIRDLKVCLEKDCLAFDIPISKSVRANFTLVPSLPGETEKNLVIKNKELSKIQGISYLVLSVPNLDMANLTYPQAITHSETANISLVLEKTTNSNCVNTTLFVLGRRNRLIPLGDISSDKKIILTLEGEELFIGPNRFSLVMVYHDLNGREYKTTKDIAISLVNVSPGERILVYLNEIELWLEKLLSKFQGVK